jgi:hypothetical protein
MCPQLPRLSPEYSHKAGLQTVITGMPLQIRPVTRGGHAGPVIMGRIARGPLSWTRPHCGMPSSPVFVWCRSKRRVSLPAVSVRAAAKQRRLRAKGGDSAFAPTRGEDVAAADLRLLRRAGAPAPAARHRRSSREHGRKNTEFRSLAGDVRCLICGARGRRTSPDLRCTRARLERTV